MRLAAVTLRAVHLMLMRGNRVKGTDAITGKSLRGRNHLRQSVNDILTTPLGSRVMRPEYGSRLFELVDSPQSKDTLVSIYAATAEALIRWEPRLSVTKVVATKVEIGHFEIALSGTYLPDGNPITMDGIVI